MNLNQNLDIIETLLKAAYITMNAAAGKPCPKELVDAELLAIKAVHHAASAHSLIKRGTWIGPHQFPDTSTAAVAARACLESYLAFHRLFVQGSDEEREFRYECWKYAGNKHWLKQVTKIRGKLTNEKHPEFRRARDRTEAEALEQRKRLLAHPQYLRLNSNDPDPKKAKHAKRLRESIKDGTEWRCASWTEIATTAGFSEDQSQILYSDLCEVAHSGQSAVDVLGNDISKDFLEARLAIPFATVRFVLARLVEDYPKVNPASAGALEDRPDLRNVTLVWAGVPEQSFEAIRDEAAKRANCSEVM